MWFSMIETTPVRVRKRDLKMLREKFPLLNDETNTYIVHMALIMLRVSELDDVFFATWKMTPKNPIS